MSLAPTVMRRVVDQAPAYGELYLTFPEHVALRTFLENNPHASVRITEGQAVEIRLLAVHVLPSLNITTTRRNQRP